MARLNAGEYPQAESSSAASSRGAKLMTEKAKLVADGVTFVDEHLEPDLPDDQRMTYYVVTLTWYARAMVTAGSDVSGAE